MNVLYYFRVIWLTLLCLVLNIPYGIDAPDGAKLRACSLDNGAVTCEQTDNGPAGSFTVRYEQTYRSTVIKGRDEDHVYIRMKVFKTGEDGLTETDERETELLYDGNYPNLAADYGIEAESDPMLVRDGDEFTLTVRFTLGKDTPSGRYSVTFLFHDENGTRPHLYKDAIIVP